MRSKKSKKNNRKSKNAQLFQNSEINALIQNSESLDKTRIFQSEDNSQATRIYSNDADSQKTMIIEKQNSKKKKGNKKEKKKKVKFSKRHPLISFFIKLIIILTLITIIVGAGIVVGMIYGMWGQDFEISEDELVLNGNSVVYDSKGNVKAELNGDESRKVIKLEDMSEYLPKAYVAIEDERFYTHSGVDFKRTIGAIGTYILHKGSSSYGGSTITQQLVKNITDQKDKSGIEGITRKVREWAKAYQIERMLSKNQILELYLNILYVGGEGNLHGVELGAEYYFDKEAKDLTLVECAFLAGINSAPNYYNPYGEKGYEENEDKRKKIDNKVKVVLKKMLETESINQKEHDDAVKEVEKGLEFKKRSHSSMIYSYHTDAVISKVIEDFMNEKGWNRDYATTYVYGGGLSIYTTEDPDITETLEDVMENTKKYQIKTKSQKDKSEKVYSQAATVIIDNETGYVVGMYGGLGEKTESRGLNRATQSTRSTGSSIKPLAELLPGLEEKIFTPATVYLDVKTEFERGTYKPTNEGAYSGEVMSVRKATGKSQNVPFVKMMAQITNAVSREYLKKLGITTVDDDLGLSLGLGGLSKGITPLEMAGAYATIENDGEYRTPLIYTKVVGNDNEIELEPKQEKRRVCSEQTAYLIKSLLTSVVTESYGTAPYCKISGIDVAAKTGTTNNHKDRWLCGFTNYYTGATWYGYDTGEVVDYSGTNPAGQIWSAIMKELHEDEDDSKFEKPDGIVSVKVCKHTGLKATSKCSDTYTEIFDEDNIPESCDESGHSSEICKESEQLATEYCPETEYRTYSYIIPTERLKLWDSSKSYSKAPVERCKIHTADAAKQNAEAPTIKLIGENKIKLKIGGNYVEKGATATDATDGDITNKIQISGNVNTSKEGTYTITYKVKNSLEKETTVTRTIEVGDTAKPTVKPTAEPTKAQATPTTKPTEKPQATPTTKPVATKEPTKDENKDKDG